MTPEEIAAAAEAAAGTETDADQEAADLWAEFEQDDKDEGAGLIPADKDEGAADDHAEGDEAGDVIEGETGEAAGVETLTAAASTVWDSAPPELRTEYERLAAENAKLLQKERSASGRATGFQRRYEELVKAAQPREAPGDRQSPQAALAALKEDYPEIAAPLEKALGVIQGEVTHLSAAEESRRAAAQNDLSEYLDAETDALRSQHPDYLEVLGKNSAKLAVWIDDQPRAVRDAFARNANDIVDAAEAATVIGLFKAHIGMPAPAPAADPLRTPATTSLASRRERQLGATANLTRSNRRPTVSGIPENGDPQDIWDAFEAAERR